MATIRTCDMPGCSNPAVNEFRIQLGARFKDVCRDCLSALKSFTDLSAAEWLYHRDAAAAAREADEARIAAEDAERAKTAQEGQ